jgi:hypothetical protein
MGLITFEDAKSQLTVRFKNRTEFASISGFDFFGEWLNKALTQLTASDTIPLSRPPLKYRFPELEVAVDMTTTAGIPYIDSPTGCLVLRHLFDKDTPYKLQWISLRQYTSFLDRADTAARNSPREYHRDGNKVWLHPTPDKLYNMEAWIRKRHGVWSGDDPTAIGAEWDDAVLELAAYKAHLWVGEQDRAKAAKEEFLQIATSIVKLSYGDEARSVNFYPDPFYFRRETR